MKRQTSLCIFLPTGDVIKMPCGEVLYITAKDAPRRFTREQVLPAGGLLDSA